MRLTLMSLLVASLSTNITYGGEGFGFETENGQLKTEFWHDTLGTSRKETHYGCENCGSNNEAHGFWRIEGRANGEEMDFEHMDIFWRRFVGQVLMENEAGEYRAVTWRIWLPESLDSPFDLIENDTMQTTLIYHIDPDYGDYVGVFESHPDATRHTEELIFEKAIENFPDVTLVDSPRTFEMSDGLLIEYRNNKNGPHIEVSDPENIHSDVKVWLPRIRFSTEGTFTIFAVPEPSTLPLLLSGTIFLFVRRHLCITR